MTNSPRTAGYDWAATLPPGQPTPIEAVELAYAEWAGVSIELFYRKVSAAEPTDFAEFYAGARDFGAADQSPRPLFYEDGEVFQPRQIETANGLKPGAVRKAISRKQIVAVKISSKEWMIEPSDYEVWWHWKGRRKRLE